MAREVERRAPELATSRWWKEEREGVFVDFNQNAKDRTVASAYSVRATPDARVSTPLRWDEVPGCRPEAFTVATVPQRFADIGDPWEGMDRRTAGGLDGCSSWRRNSDPRRRRRRVLGATRDRPASVRDAADRDRPHQDQRRGDGRAGHLARPLSRRGRSLQPADVLVDGMRGPSSIWYRIRINLQHVPDDQRPPQEELIADYSPWKPTANPLT